MLSAVQLESGTPPQAPAFWFPAHGANLKAMEEPVDGGPGWQAQVLKVQALN